MDRRTCSCALAAVLATRSFTTASAWAQTWVKAQGMAGFVQANTTQWKKVANYARISLE